MTQIGDKALSSSAGLKGGGLAVLSAALHAGVPVAGAYAQQEMDTLTFGFLWVGLIALYTWIYFTLRWRWGAVADAVKAHWCSLLLMGLLQAVGVWTFFYGLRFIDPTEAAFFGRASAVFSVILGVIFLRERFTLAEIAGILLAVGGAAVITHKGGRPVLIGLAGVVTSCLCFALFTLVAKIKAHAVGPFVLVSASTTFSAVLLGVYGLAFGGLDFEASASRHAALAAACFSGGFLGIGAFYASFKYIRFSIASALRSAQAVFVALLAYFTLGTVPGLKSWVGGAIIIAGVTLLALGGRAADGGGAAEAAGDGDG